MTLGGGSAAHAALPVVFEANQGQADADVRFLSRTARYTLFITQDGAVLAAGRADETVRVRLVGARPDAEVMGLERLPGVVHYLRGADPARWRIGVPTYAGVAYHEVYAGIDAMYRAGAWVEQMFVIQPGADPAAIRLRFEGARNLAVDDAGDLRVALQEGEFRLKRPVAYQQIDGVRRDVPAAWVIGDGAEAGFQLGRWDRSRPMVIDPEIVWATYLGGRGTDAAFAVAVDSAGGTYVAGETRSLDFPSLSVGPVTCNADQFDGGCFLGDNSDAFVVKIDPNGAMLLYAVVLAGGGEDGARAIAVDEAGNAYVAGFTDSPDFPTTPGVLQRGPGGGLDAFVVKLGPTGAVLYSTYLGGAEADVALGIDVDVFGTAHVAGGTRSADFPIFVDGLPWDAQHLHPLQGTIGGGRDAFLAVLDSDGAMLYSTFLGGSADDSANGLALDRGSGLVWLAGFTLSSDFPTTPDGLQPGDGAGQDAFLARLCLCGSTPFGGYPYEMEWGTYLGGSGTDTANAIAVRGDHLYVVGSTSSPDFPATSGDSFSGTGEGFITKLSPFDSVLLWSRSLGDNVPAAVAIDAVGTDIAGDALVVSNGPACTGLFPCAPHVDVFVERRLAPNGERFRSIQLGGSDTDCCPPDDLGHAIAVDGPESVWVVGVAIAHDFPTTPGSVQPGIANSFSDAFVAKLAYEGLQLPDGAPPGEDSGASSSGCFIATAAFGSPLAAEVEVLRRFRDRMLVTNTPGRLLVRAYYWASPPVAEAVVGSPFLRAMARRILLPIIRGAGLALDHPLMVLGLLAAGSIAGTAVVLKTRLPGRRLLAAMLAGTVVIVGVLSFGSPPDPPLPGELRRPPAPGSPQGPPRTPHPGRLSTTGARLSTPAARTPQHAGSPTRPSRTPVRLHDLALDARRGASVQLLNPLAPPAQRRWAIASGLIAGILGPEGFSVTDPRLGRTLGIQSGDIIVGINGHPPRHVLAAVSEVQRDPDRATVVVEIDRAGGRIVQSYQVR